jgi:hypothetical protein
MRLLASAFEAAGSVPGTRRGCLRDLLSIPTPFAWGLSPRFCRCQGLSPCICPGFLSCPNERRFAIPTAT